MPIVASARFVSKINANLRRKRIKPRDNEDLFSLEVTINGQTYIIREGYSKNLEITTLNGVLLLEARAANVFNILTGVK